MEANIKEIILIPMQLMVIRVGDIFKLTRDSKQEFTFEGTVKGRFCNQCHRVTTRNNQGKIKAGTLWLDSCETVFLITEI